MTAATPTKRAIARYHAFQRGQTHEDRGQFRLALWAYRAAGALRSEARMRQVLAFSFKRYARPIPHAA